MSASPECVMFSGQKTARSPEKSSFLQTSGLFSEYLTEKSSFGDLSLGINENATPELLKQTTTMNLFPMTGGGSHKQVASRTDIRSMDLFPQQSSSVKEDLQTMIDSRVNRPASPESQNAQLTIFYGGQVIVFNDFPADKAKEVMVLASKASSFNGFPSVPANSHLHHHHHYHPGFASNVAKPSVDSSNSNPSSSSVGPKVGNNLIQERIQTPPAIANDLPIARRASLHRFLEKRKDRITTKSPYQTSGLSGLPLKAAAETKSWLGLAATGSPQHL